MEQKVIRINSYHINEETIYLQPFLDEATQRIQTFVCEGDRFFIVRKKVEEICKVSCMQHKMKYSKNQMFIKKKLKSDKKVPIVISIDRGITLFPTSSIRQLNNCIYLVNEQVDRVLKLSTGCRVYFQNGMSRQLSTDVSLIQKQMNRGQFVQGCFKLEYERLLCKAIWQGDI